MATKNLINKLFSKDYEIYINLNYTAPVGKVYEAGEKQLIEWVYNICKKNKTKAAKILGLSRSTFYSKLSKYDIY